MTQLRQAKPVFSIEVRHPDGSRSCEVDAPTLAKAKAEAKRLLVPLEQPLAFAKIYRVHRDGTRPLVHVARLMPRDNGELEYVTEDR